MPAENLNLIVRQGNGRVTITDDARTFAEMRPVGSVADVLSLAHKFAAADDLYQALEACLTPGMPEEIVLKAWRALDKANPQRKIDAR